MPLGAIMLYTVQLLYVYSVVYLGSGCGARPRPKKPRVRLTRQLGPKAQPDSRALDDGQVKPNNIF